MTKEKYDFLFAKLLRDCNAKNGLIIILKENKAEICSKISIKKHGKFLPDILRGLANDIEGILENEKEDKS